MLKDRQTNVTPDSDGTVWQLIAQGDSGAVMNTRGDMLIQDALKLKISQLVFQVQF